MVHTVTFDPDGEQLKVKLTFTGLMVASYTFTLWSAEDNSQVMCESGNNQNPADDDYDLPEPAAANDGRLIQVRTELLALDAGIGQPYAVRAEVFQGGEGPLPEVAEDAGKLTGKAQSSLLFVCLKSA